MRGARREGLAPRSGDPPRPEDGSLAGAGWSIHHRRRLGRDAVPVDEVIGHGERDGHGGGIRSDPIRSD